MSTCSINPFSIIIWVYLLHYLSSILSTSAFQYLLFKTEIEFSVGMFHPLIGTGVPHRPCIDTFSTESRYRTVYILNKKNIK